jgi:hypothetical protein
MQQLSHIRDFFHTSRCERFSKMQGLDLQGEAKIKRLLVKYEFLTEPQKSLILRPILEFGAGTASEKLVPLPVGRDSVEP